MKAAIVGKAGSRLHGVKCRCCTRPAQEGQSVLEHRLDAHGYENPIFLVHTLCMAEAVERAPAGAPVRNAKVEYAAIRARSLALARG